MLKRETFIAIWESQGKFILKWGGDIQLAWRFETEKAGDAINCGDSLFDGDNTMTQYAVYHYEAACQIIWSNFDIFDINLSTMSLLCASLLTLPLSLSLLPL